MMSDKIVLFQHIIHICEVSKKLAKLSAELHQTDIIVVGMGCGNQNKQAVPYYKINYVFNHDRKVTVLLFERLQQPLILHSPRKGRP